MFNIIKLAYSDPISHQFCLSYEEKSHSRRAAFIYDYNRDFSLEIESETQPNLALSIGAGRN